MTHPKTPQAMYEELVAAIVKAVPEIEQRREKQRKEVVVNLGDLYWCGRVWEGWNYGTMKEEDFEPAWENEDAIASFLTDDITLEDVLLAMWHGEDMKYVTLKPHRKKGCALIHFEIPEATGAILGLSNAQMRTSFGEWHLGHDLSWHRDNEPETIAFLHSLLCR